jgi:hypothetical protein
MMIVNAYVVEEVEEGVVVRSPNAFTERIHRTHSPNAFTERIHRTHSPNAFTERIYAAARHAKISRKQKIHPKPKYIPCVSFKQHHCTKPLATPCAICKPRAPRFLFSPSQTFAKLSAYSCTFLLAFYARRDNL